ncbi:hypothetical protein ACFVJH_01840 [Streptomyces decoyicus]|uniref:hypothetical protein n=1 Tax=Streptomyces decoyicus TaxID=249567 RepID=UPI00362BB723
MPIIGPGYDDPEYDNYDPAWESPGHSLPAMAVREAHRGRRHCEHGLQLRPAKRYHGLSREDFDYLATVADTAIEAGQAAHQADSTNGRASSSSETTRTWPSSTQT